jgi:hypothetical protein
MNYKKNIKRAKLESEGKIKQQVFNFNYLRYIISYDDNDISIKLQKYNKLNGMIKGHFCKHMTTETKLQKYITLLTKQLCAMAVETGL